MQDISLSTAIERIVAERRIPRATYRVQLNADFTFRDAAAIVPYLHDLGISDLYVSPILKAKPGSTHGYDVCDPSQLNPVLGTEEDFRALVGVLQEHNMGLLLDIVPNHMSVSTDCNLWWLDVLENGASSRYANFFDIDWHPVKQELTNRVLLPVLEDQYGFVLEAGKLQVIYENGAFFVMYGETRFPVTMDSYGMILSPAIEILETTLGAEDPQIAELQSFLTAIQHLPAYHETEVDKTTERNRDVPIIKRRLAEFVEAYPDTLAAIQDALHRLNGIQGEAASFDALDRLLNAQPYRLAFWRVASDEINYRRFFDINEMAAIHTEYPEVFAAVHERVMQLLADGSVTGLRVDHPDGLWNPTAYFRQLQESYLISRLKSEYPDMEEAALSESVTQWLEAHVEEVMAAPPLYVVAEKILAANEPLPLNWMVDGTTGYDFMNQLNGLFVQSANEEQFTDIYNRFLGRAIHFPELVYNSKNLIMDEAMFSEIRTLSHRLERITETSRYYRDYTLTGLQTAIREIIAELPIYRTYITGVDNISERDQRYIIGAILKTRYSSGLSRLLLSFIRDTLLLHNLGNFPPEERSRLENFVMKFQQLTGPVMAKSVEDTAFYVYNRLVSLNEVGGHPDHFGSSADEFHQQIGSRMEQWQHTMLATSTHDTKRSEDVRARLNVLSEIPSQWEAAVHRWSGMLAEHKTELNGRSVPNRNEEYLFYQSLLGIWQDDARTDELRERLTAYMTKAANEAKVNTSWTNPNEEHIVALHAFISSTLGDTNFLNDFRGLHRTLDYYGCFNSLAQTLLKLTIPGVPDIYQGTEYQALSLVDPDNRRPVDYERPRNAIQRVKQATASGQSEFHTESSEDTKLYIIARTLAFRREYPLLFEKGSYEPIEVTGEKSQHVLAFLRRREDQSMVVVVPRLLVGLTNGEFKPSIGTEVWKDTRLNIPPNPYRNLFTGTTVLANSENNGILVADILAEFPLALLITE